MTNVNDNGGNLPSASFTVYIMHSGDKITADVSNAGVRLPASMAMHLELKTFSRNVKERNNQNDANATIVGRGEDGT
jgi:hypothetical protein